MNVSGAVRYGVGVYLVIYTAYRQGVCLANVVADSPERAAHVLKRAHPEAHILGIQRLNKVEYIDERLAN